MSRHPFIASVLTLALLSQSAPALAFSASGSADKAFQDHNYKQALSLYQSTALNSENQGYLRLQILKTQAKLKQWDRWVQTLDSALEAQPETVWKARIYHFASRIYEQIPHQGYQRKGKVYRNTQHREGKYVYLYSQDQKTSLEYDLAARHLYEKLWLKAPSAALAKEYYLFNTSYFQKRVASRYVNRAKNKQPLLVPQLKPVSFFNPKWPALKQAFMLYQDNQNLAQWLNDKGLFVENEYQWITYLIARFGQQSTNYPYSDPLEMLQKLGASHPKDVLAPEIRFVTGTLFQGRKKYIQALEVYESLMADWPGSPFVEHAKAEIQEIKWPQLSLQVDNHIAPEEQPKYTFSGRNTPVVNFSLHRIQAQDILKEHIKERNHHFRELHQELGEDIKTIRSHYKETISKWKVSPKSKTHGSFRHKGQIPKSLQPGVYILEAATDKLWTTALLVVSDLVITQEKSKNEYLYYVAEAQTGQPIANASLSIKETSTRNKSNSKVTQVTTDAQGMYVYRSRFPQDYSYVEAMASSEGHLALTRQNYWSRYQSKRKSTKVHAQTDRPIYRPGQKVQFKLTLRDQVSGAYRSPKARKFLVWASNPKGEKVFETTVSTDAQGQIFKEFTLKPKAALGQYRIQLKALDNQSHQLSMSSGYRFRVEEYKRPEYAVKVLPQGDPRPGESANALIQAHYFFGAPVSGAKVKYTVYKKPFYMSSGRFHPYRWLYGDIYSSNRSRYGRNQVVTQNTGKLNAKGQLKISFPTDSSTQNYTYEIKAEVVDSSRRMQAGSGKINLAHQSYFASLSHPKGFYSLGERIDTEIQLKDPNGQKITGQKGQFKVYQLKYENKKYIRSLVYQKQITSDQYGRAFARWKPEDAGEFVFAFEGKDKYERSVKSEKELWVSGPNFKGQQLKFDRIEIYTDKRIYKEGDTARVLVNSQAAQSHVLFMEDGGEKLLSHRLLNLKDHSEVITLKIQKHHVPNFKLKAVMVHDRQLFQDSQELFVPPADQLLKLAISSSKNSYLPGEKAHFDIQVKDYLNRPLKTALTLGVADASIYEIEPDNTADIRTFFYGFRRSFSNQLSHSLGMRFSSRSDHLIKRKKYRHFYRSRRQGRLRDRFGKGGAGEALYDNDALPALEEAEADLTMSAPTPKPQAAARRKESKGLDDRFKKSSDEKNELGVDGAPQKPAETKTRSNFSETAYWNPILQTNAQGKARFSFDFPDSLTTWKVKASGISYATQVGSAQTEVKTTKNILLRLQAPRFFVQKDEVVLSANISNQFKSAQWVTAQVQLPPELKLLSKASQKVKVSAQGQKRVDWRVKVIKSGQAKITMKALNSKESDAVQMQFPVKVYGSQKTVTQNGAFKGQSKTLRFNLPSQRQKKQTQLKLTLNPSLAGTLLDALPYLAEFPYGCIEQTTSRFVPALITANTLKKRGIKLSDLGKQGLNTGSLAMKNPVQDEDQLKAMIDQGLKRIYGFQNPDGGWGWWSGYSSDPYMTAYVVYALQLAEDSDYGIQKQVIKKGLGFLKSQFKAGATGDRQAFQAYVLSIRKQISSSDLSQMFKKRDDLSHYSKALLALAYHHLGDAQKSNLILENLKSFVQVDAKNQTASWQVQSRYWWHWYNDRIETNAFILKAFVKIQPKDTLVPQVVRWLVNNRQGNRWKSTKDTAHVLYALNDYLKESNELGFKGTIKVKLNGKLLKSMAVTPQNILSFERELNLPDQALKTGQNTLTIEKPSGAPLYYSAGLKYFTQEDKIKGTGNEILIDRKYYLIHQRLDPKTKQVKEEKVLLKEGAVIQSGERVEVRLNIESKNDYEYLMFEDFKPAGFETLTQKSGYVYQNGIYLNRELRDDKVVFFMNSLPQGNQVLTYRLRAEIPGYFHALPHHGEAMYAPKVSGISDSFTLGIKDAP